MDHDDDEVKTSKKASRDADDDARPGHGGK